MDVDECWQLNHLCSLSLSRYDYVEIHDGNSESADLLGKHCSNIAPAPIISSGPSLHIKFVSDYAHQGAGFSLRYEIFKTGNWTLLLLFFFTVCICRFFFIIFLTVTIMCFCNVGVLIEVFHGFIAKTYTETFSCAAKGMTNLEF